jgi:hypothetical protein
MFPYQALGRTRAQETLIGCAGLHNEKDEDNEHSLCITYVVEKAPLNELRNNQTTTAGGD